MIVCFEGLPGSGKTAMAVKYCYMLAQKRFKNYDDDMERLEKGKIKPEQVRYFEGVHSNMRSLKIAENTIRSYEELLTLSHAVVLLDEAQVWFFSRNWNRIKDELIFYWSQTRKRGMDIIYTAQSFEFVDVDVRRVTDFVFRCKFFGGFVLTLKREVPRSERYRWGGVSCVRKSFSRYDTKEVILRPLEEYDSLASRVAAEERLDSLYDFSPERLRETFERLLSHDKV